MQSLNIWIFLSILFPVVLGIIPSWLYKKETAQMAKFYLVMIGKEAARKLYIHVLLITLLVFHYVYISGHFGEYDVLFSTIFTVGLFFYKWTDKCLHKIHKSQKTFIITGLVVLAIIPIPHLYTMAVTLGYILLAAAFYPSESALEGWQEEKTRKLWNNRPKELVKAYYSNIPRDCHDIVDSGNSDQSTQCTINNSKQE